MRTVRSSAAALGAAAVVATTVATGGSGGLPGTFQASLPGNLCAAIGADAVRGLIPTVSVTAGRTRDTPYGQGVSCTASAPGLGAGAVVVTLGRYPGAHDRAEPVFRDLVARFARRDAPVGQRTESAWVADLGDVARRRTVLVGEYSVTRIDLVVRRRNDVVTVEFSAERAPRAYVEAAAAGIARRALR